MNVAESQVWQRNLLQCLEEAAPLEGINADECNQLREKLANGVFSLVVAGQFKRGKSSLINAMLGKNVLPVGVVPLTSIVTVLRYGVPPAANVQFQSGEMRSVPLDTIAEYVTEKGNPNNTKSVRTVFIDYPSVWLHDGTQIVDTPGIDSVYQHNTDVTHAYLPQADAVLFVASVDQPLSRRELDFLVEIRQFAAKVFCVLNKSDYLDADELQESVAFSSRALRDSLGDIVQVFPVSARLALAGKLSGPAGSLERSGLGSLESALRVFLDHEKTEIWRRSLSQNLHRLLAKSHLTVQVELQALSAPLDQLEAVLKYLDQKQDEIMEELDECEILLTSDTDRLLKNGVEPALTRFKDGLKQALPAHIEAWYGEMRKLPLGQVERELESRIIAHVRVAYDQWRASQDLVWNRQFEAMCSKYWSRMQATIEDMQRHATELLSIPYQTVNADLLWRAESGFYYKFWDEPPSLLVIRSALVRLLPKAAGGPLILRRLTQYGLELVETQAGRVRYDCDERLTKNLQNFLQFMQERVQSALGEMAGAIRKGTAMNRESKPVIEARRKVLSELNNNLSQLQSRVSDRLSVSPDSPAVAHE